MVAAQPALRMPRRNMSASTPLVVAVCAAIFLALAPASRTFAGALSAPRRTVVQRQAIFPGMEVDRKTETITEEQDKRLFGNLLDGVEGDYDEIERENIYKVPEYKTPVGQYTGYVYSKKKHDRIRLRMERFGDRHAPFYQIQAMQRTMTPKNSTKYYERIGHWNPRLPADHPEALHIKADRAVYWLNRGAVLSDQVASFLDLVGVIRRTGREAKLGEWEWRVPSDTIEAPEGWSYFGPEEHVSWGNAPDFNKKLLKSGGDGKYRPAMEKYGFRGYRKIPLERDVAEAPLDGTSRMKTTSWDSVTDNL